MIGGVACPLAGIAVCVAYMAAWADVSFGILLALSLLVSSLCGGVMCARNFWDRI